MIPRVAGTVLVLVLAACDWAPPPTPAEVAKAKGPVKVALEDRVVKRAELVCFPCHSQVVFEKGPAFPHKSIGHRSAGHCHRCHIGSAHEGRQIDRSACLSCHEADSEELQPPSTSDTPRK
jgi:hypothetical protein